MRYTVALLLGVLAVLVEPGACFDQELEDAASTFAEQWAGGQTRVLQSRLASAGVRI